MSKTAYVVLAEGFEEIEASTPIDVLRRAGIDVTVVGVGGSQVKGAHGVIFGTDKTIDQIQDLPDTLVLPGGLPGADNLAASNEVNNLINKANDAGKLIAAICASPARVLSPLGLLKDKSATCYPGFEKEFSSNTTFSSERVVRDGNILTSRGPGSALRFALELVAILVSQDKADELAEGMLVTCSRAQL